MKSTSRLVNDSANELLALLAKRQVEASPAKTQTKKAETKSASKVV